MNLDLPDEVCSVEENERWHQENRRLRLLMGDTEMGPLASLRAASGPFQQ